MDEPLSLILLVALAAFLVGLSKGGLPAVATLGVPVLALVMSPVVAAALLLPIYIVTDWVGLWLYRRTYSARNLRILIPAGLLGVLIGWAIAARVSDGFVGLLVGVVGIAYCLNAWIRHRSAAEARPADVPRGVFWGTLAGFTSFVSHSGAPPFQMYVLPQKLEKLAFAGTATILFAIINLAKLVPYWELELLQHHRPQAAAPRAAGRHPRHLRGREAHPRHAGQALLRPGPGRALRRLAQARLGLLLKPPPR